MMHLYGRKSRLQNIVPKIELGLHTIQFIQFYFKDPQSILKNIDEKYIELELFRKEMSSIHFLHQENLNSELKSFLLKIGFEQKQIQTIDPMEKINVTTKFEDDCDSIDTALENGAQELILEREKLLFKIFPEYLPQR
jgi:hypothetical protein